MATPERKTKDAIRDLFDKYGVYYFMPVQSGYGAPSLDFICTGPKGYSFFVEAKATVRDSSGRWLRTTPTARQSNLAHTLYTHGIPAFLVSDMDTLYILRRYIIDQATDSNFSQEYWSYVAASMWHMHIPNSRPRQFDRHKAYLEHDNRLWLAEQEATGPKYDYGERLLEYLSAGFVDPRGAKVSDHRVFEVEACHNPLNIKEE